MKNQYIVTQDEAGTRLDRFVADKETSLSRSFIQKLISDGCVTVGDAKTKPSHNVRAGDIVKVLLVTPQSETIPQAEDIPIDIVYEDDEIIVVNKPAGMVVHPAAGVTSGTLVNALLSHIPSGDQDDYDEDEPSLTDSLDVNSENWQRPGIVHRIDKGTSGLLVVAKTSNAYNSLASQVKEHSMTRRYIALICGIPKQDKGTIIAPIGRSNRDRKKMAVMPVRSRDAITHFTVLEKYGDFSLVEVRIETGRTHQIRVHFAYIGHPVVGDPDYGGRDRALKTQTSESVTNVIKNLSRQALHAELLGFKHPKSGKYMEFVAPIPEDMQALIERMKDER